MASQKKEIKGYVKTENMILLIITALALGFFGGVVYSVYRTTGTASMTGGGAASMPMTAKQQANLAGLIQETKEHPENAEAWTSLGHFYFDAGRYEEAISAYETSLKIDGNRPDVWTDLGVMYRRSGNPGKAVESFDRALAIKPDHAVAMYNKGIVLMHDLKEPGKAVEIWEKLLQVNPDATTPAGEPLRNIIDQLKRNMQS